MTAKLPMRIFAFINAGRGTDLVRGMALAEDGTCVAGHVSSSDAWSRNDMLTMHDDDYLARYPQGFYVEWVDDPKNHPGVMAAYAKNQQTKKAK